MILVVRNNVSRYRIECPDHVEVRRDGDTDYLVVADPDDPSMTQWLADDILLEAARAGAFGLRLVSVDALN